MTQKLRIQGLPSGSISRVWLLLLCLLAIALSSCIGLRRADRHELAELRGVGIAANEQAVTVPVLAGVLNLLPGVGNFYLAASADEGGQWAVGFLNLLTWPWSIVWGVPQAAIDASTVNKLSTIDYYMHTPYGRRELEDRRRRLLEADAAGSDGRGRR